MAKFTQKISRLKEKLIFYKAFTLGLIFLIVGLFSFIGFNWLKENTLELGITDMEKEAPYYKEIAEIIKPLRYSGLNDLFRPEVSISLDFDEKTWTLHNIHRFDKDGKIILADGRFGLCGELAAYVYDKISPLFDNRYKVEFFLVAQADYFPPPHGSHIVLKITDPASFPNRQSYILDPSFRRYGKMEKFEDYIFIHNYRMLPFMAGNDPDGIFSIDSQTPLLIKKQHSLNLAVDSAEGKFDKNNFALALTATKRGKYFSRFILVFRKNNGLVQKFEDKKLALSILSEEEYRKLYARLLHLFEKL